MIKNTRKDDKSRENRCIYTKANTSSLENEILFVDWDATAPRKQTILVIDPLISLALLIKFNLSKCHNVKLHNLKIYSILPQLHINLMLQLFIFILAWEKFNLEIFMTKNIIFLKLLFNDLLNTCDLEVCVCVDVMTLCHYLTSPPLLLLGKSLWKNKIILWFFPLIELESTQYISKANVIARWLGRIVIFSIEFLISFKTLVDVARWQRLETFRKLIDFRFTRQREKRWSLNNIKISFSRLRLKLLYSCSLCNSFLRHYRWSFVVVAAVVVFGRSAVKLDCKAIAVSFIFEGIVEVSFFGMGLEAAYFSSLARSRHYVCEIRKCLF